MEPKIILSNTKESRKHHKSNDIVATAWIKNGRPTVHVWKPRKFTRRVREHELAHLRQPGPKDKDTIVEYCRYEIDAERRAAKAMGKDAELDAHRAFQYAHYFFLEWKETEPSYRQFFKTWHEYMKWANASGFFHVCGFTDKEIAKLNRVYRLGDDYGKRFKVTLELVKDGKKRVYNKEVIAESKRDAYDMVSDSVPAAHGVWTITKSDVAKCEGKK